MKLFSKKGRVSENNGGGYSKSSGKNEKHSNFKAREAAKSKMEAAQKKLKEMREGGDINKDKIEKTEKEIKHWKKKMDDVGETHHRR